MTATVDDWEARLDAAARLRVRLEELGLPEIHVRRRKSALDLAQQALKVLLGLVQRAFVVEQRVQGMAPDALKAGQRVGRGDGGLIGQGEDQPAVAGDFAGQGNDLVCQSRGGAIVHLSSPVGVDSHREPRPGESDLTDRPAGVDGGAA